MEQALKIVYPETTAYVRGLLPAREGYLHVMEAEAQANAVPIVQPEVAQYLDFLVQLIKPNRVLEIGTAIGYSASRIALSMSKGKIDTIELRQDMADIATETFKKLHVLQPEVSVNLHVGQAQSIIQTLEGPYDLVFIDAAKGHYQTFFDQVFPLVTSGGVIVSDNVLFRGMVADDTLVLPKYKTIVKRMRAYLAYISRHEALTTSVLSIGDGVSVSIKGRSDHL